MKTAFNTTMDYVIAIMVMITLLLTGCSRHDHDHAGGDSRQQGGESCGHDHGHEHAHTHKPGESCDHDHGHAHEHETREKCNHDHGGKDAATTRFEIPEHSQRLLGLTFATAEKRSVRSRARFPGWFELMPGARRIYGAPLPGVLELHVRPLQHVKTGEKLCVLRAPEWQKMRSEVAMAEAELTLIVAEEKALNERLKRLREIGTRNAEMEMQLRVKQAELQRAQHTLKSVTAATQAILLPDFTVEGHDFVFRAREDGIVERIPPENGAWVESGNEILCITQERQLWFKADGYPMEMANVRSGMRGVVEPLTADIGAFANGIIELGLATDDTTRIQPIYLTPVNMPDWAAPGRAGVLNIIMEESEPDTVAVPRACVVQDGIRQLVFIRDPRDTGHFYSVEVRLGADDGEWVEVEGVPDGATVTLEGAYELKLAAPGAGGQRKPTGHFHADGQFHEGEH